MASKWTVGTNRNLPVVAGDWDGAAAEASVFEWAGFDGDNPDSSKAKQAFLIYDANVPDLKGSYKLPIAKHGENGLQVIKGGMDAAAGYLSRTDAPQDVLDDARSVLDHYYDKWEKQQKQVAKRFSVTSLRKSVDSEKRIVTCIAMAAYEIDAHGDMFLPTAVEKMSHNFLSGYNLTSSLDKQHSVDVDADLVGSFYVEKSTNVDGLDVPDFSWVAQWHINDDVTWDQVQKSELTGFSIFGEASGWKVNENTEVMLAEHLAKAKAGDSQYTKPLRVFDGGTASRLSIVDAGANLHFAIYKRKDQMADTRETVTTEATKAKAPAQPETPAAVETPSEPAPAQVEKSAPAQAPDPVQSLIRKMAIAESLDLEMLRKAYDQIGAALQLGGASQPASTPAPAPAAQPDTATLIKAAVSEATEELRKQLGDQTAKIEELRKAKVASSGAPDPEPEDPTKVQKAKNPNDVFGGVMTGIFG